MLFVSGLSSSCKLICCVRPPNSFDKPFVPSDYDLLPEKKQPSLDFDDIPMGDDESFGSDDYGDEATAFNEDGSFIGQYAKTKKGGPPAYHPAESNV